MAAQRRHAGLAVSLPQVLVAILDGIQRGGTSVAEIAAWIRKDPALTAETLVAARACGAPTRAHCDTVENAIAALGPDGARALVLDVASRQFFAPRPGKHLGTLHRIWREALMAADLAQVLATLTRYRDPEQARICGLLLGARSAESLAPDAAEPPDTPMAGAGSEQGSIGLHVAEAWCPDSFAVDAIRYQCSAADEVRDAHHLVKIVNLARRIAVTEDEDTDAIHAAEMLFGLEAELTRTLRRRVALDVDRLAEALGMPLSGGDLAPSEADAYAELGQHLDRIARVNRIRAELREASDTAAIRAKVGTAARTLLAIERSLLFVVDAREKHLLAWLEGGEEPAFVVALAPGRSLVADTLLTGKPQRGAGRSVVDRQLAGILRTEQLWCIPLLYQDSRLGVLVLGLPPEGEDVAASRDAAAGMLADEVAAVLAARSVGNAGRGPDGGTDSVGRAELRFAASTPLSVIHNHLGVLRTRLQGDVAAMDDLERIREETLRIERILDEDRSPMPAVHRDAALNDLVGDVVASLDSGLLAPAGIRVRLEMDPLGPRVREGSNVQTLLRRLLQHAGENGQVGSELVVATRGQVSVNGREHVELEIRIGRPGLQSDDLQERLHELTAAIGGTMIFTSDRSGLRCQLLVPGRSAPDPESGGRGVA